MIRLISRPEFRKQRNQFSSLAWYIEDAERFGATISQVDKSKREPKYQWHTGAIAAEIDSIADDGDDSEEGVFSYLHRTGHPFASAALHACAPCLYLASDVDDATSAEFRVQHPQWIHLLDDLTGQAVAMFGLLTHFTSEALKSPIATDSSRAVDKIGAIAAETNASRQPPAKS